MGSFFAGYREWDLEPFLLPSFPPSCFVRRRGETRNRRPATVAVPPLLHLRTHFKPSFIRSMHIIIIYSSNHKNPCISIFKGAFSATFTIINQCSYTVWPGLLSGAGTPPLSITGFSLQSTESTAIPVPAAWSGQVGYGVGPSAQPTPPPGNSPALRVIVDHHWNGFDFDFVLATVLITELNETSSSLSVSGHKWTSLTCYVFSLHHCV